MRRAETAQGEAHEEGNALVGEWPLGDGVSDEMARALGDHLGRGSSPGLIGGAVLIADNAGRKTVQASDAARAAQRQGIFCPSAAIPPPPAAGSTTLSKKDRAYAAEIKRMRLAHAAEIREIDRAHAAEIREKDRAHAAEIAQLQAQLAAQQR